MKKGTSRTWAPACAAALGLWLAGCAGGDSLTCDEDGRYTESDSIPPVRVPEGLSPPDQDEALQIPSAPGPDSPQDNEGCLETPPEYFDE